MDTNRGFVVYRGLDVRPWIVSMRADLISLWCGVVWGSVAYASVSNQSGRHHRIAGSTSDRLARLVAVTWPEGHGVQHLGRVLWTQHLLGIQTTFEGLGWGLEMPWKERDRTPPRWEIAKYGGFRHVWPRAALGT